MRLEKVIVNFNADKLQAIKFLSPEVYNGLEKQMEEYIEKIYVKSVPQSTRKYIEAKMKEENSVQNRIGKNSI